MARPLPPCRAAGRRCGARPGAASPATLRLASPALRSSLAGNSLTPWRVAGPQWQQQQQQQGLSERRQVVAQAGLGRGSPDVADRVLSSLPYLLPLLDGLR